MPTIGEYADHWVAGLRLQNSTIQGYKKIIRNHLTPYLGTIRLDKLTATRIAAHYRALETSGRRDKPGYGKPLSANTVSKVHVLLAAMLDAAVDDGMILINPAKKKRTVNPPSSSQVRAQKPEIITWTGPQLQAFLTWNHEDLDDELFPLWRTIAYTGMRRSEALALRWSDLNFITGRIGLAGPSTSPPQQHQDHQDRKRPRPRHRRRDARASSRPQADRGAISLGLARADSYVFGDDRGASVRPTRSPAAGPGVERARPGSRACRESPSKDCGTPTRPCCSSWGSTPRSSRSASGTPPSPRR